MPKRVLSGRNLAGILLLDKPSGITSNRALQRAKRLFGAAKAGHTGSLDPLATGMLPICFGAATRISPYLLNARKTYRVVGRLGTATDTGDADGRVTTCVAAPALDAATLRGALTDFCGSIEQTPPMYSALKHEGSRLYELARQGIEVKRKARRVTIDELTLEDLSHPDFTLYVRCSKGTYIRSLITDLGLRLGTVAHVVALRRLSVEPFSDATMHDFGTLERFAAESQSRLDAALLPIDTALAGWPRVVLDGAAALALCQGRAVAADPSWPHGPVLVYAPSERLLGLGEVLARGTLVPRKLFGC